MQEIYEVLADQKKPGGDNVFVFWDKECPNPGQNWEEGFLFGAKAIILLISSQVCVNSQLNFLLIRQTNFQALDGIRQNSHTKKDNVLIEYPVNFFVIKKKD